MKKRLEKILNFLMGRKAALEKTANSLSGDDLMTVQNTIKELDEQIEETRNAITEFENGEKTTQELRTQISELQNSVKTIKEAMNTAKKSVNTLAELAKTKEFRAAFVETVNNTVEPREFKKAWREKVDELMAKNSIDADNIAAGDFLPGFILNEISDSFIGKRHRLLELVDWTGLPMWKSLFETGEEMGHTHERGTEKTEQELSFAATTIRPDYVYKFQRVDQVLLRETRDMDDVLYRYIIAELLDRVLKTVENYIVTGHGTDHFIKAQEVAIAQNAGGNNIMEAGYYMDDSEGAIAIMSKAKYYDIKTTLAAMVAQGGRIVTHDDVLAYLGVEEIVFNNSTFVPTTVGYTWNGILFMSPRDYKLVGDRRPDQYEDFNLAYNKKEYLMEIYIGGGCTKPNQFVALCTAE
jgi:archaellum component FlaC